MNLKRPGVPFLLGCLMITATSPLPAAIEQVRPHPRGASFQLTASD